MHNKQKIILFIVMSWMLASSVESLTQKITLENYYQEKFEILINRIIPKDKYLVNVDIKISETNIKGGTKETKEAQKLAKKTSTPRIEEKEEESIVSKEEDFFDLFGNSAVEENIKTEEVKEEQKKEKENEESEQGELNTAYSDGMAIESFYVSIYLDPSFSTKQTQVQEILCESIYIQSTESCSNCECINFNILDSGMNLSLEKEGSIENSGTSENILKEYEVLIGQMRDDREREEAERITKETKGLEKELKSIESLYESLRIQNKQEDSTKLAFYERKDRSLQRKRDSLLVVLEGKTEEARMAYYRQGQDFQEKQFTVMMEMVKMKDGKEMEAGTSGGSSGSGERSYAPRQPYQNGKSSNMIWILIVLLICGGFVGLFFILKPKPAPVYLRPKNKEKNNENHEFLQGEAATAPPPQISEPIKEAQIAPTQNKDVIRAEVKSLRQSAVSMSVGQKEAATKIIEDWLDEPSQDNNNQDESEKEE